MKLKPKRNVNQNSGFNRHVAVSNEMCEFLRKSHGSLVSRTEVTKYVSKYIKAFTVYSFERCINVN
jgi:hypothetical protein